jgi:hypothetical protein
MVDAPPDTSDQEKPPSLPAADIGLMAPQITELLPNPDGTGNDAEDEFIELYNPNPKPFDLTGFKLQVGLTTLRFYTLPAGTMLAPGSFTAFYAADTKLSLSNSGSQVKLLDPFDNSISATDIYATAKDGQGWALAKGKWYWTTKLTPKAANIIQLPPAKKAAAKKAPAKKTATGTAVKPAKTSQGAGQTLAGSFTDVLPTTPIHAWVLALVAGLALLYGLYEYRADLANRLYRLRRHFGRGRPDRPEAPGRRDD